MNESVAFIIFYDDERYLEECVYYINKLQVPHGIHVEIMGVGGFILDKKSLIKLARPKHKFQLTNNEIQCRK